MLRSTSRFAPIAAGFTTMSAPTVRDAANSTSAQQNASVGITYIASCSPTARNASVIAGAPASAIARRARKSESLPVRYVPMLAPMTYIAKK